MEKTQKKLPNSLVVFRVVGQFCFFCVLVQKFLHTRRGSPFAGCLTLYAIVFVCNGGYLLRNAAVQRVVLAEVRAIAEVVFSHEAAGLLRVQLPHRKREHE